MEGLLYERLPTGWEAVALPQADGSYLTDLQIDAYLVDLEFQYPTTLWALDAKGKRLWTTTDGKTWRLIPVVVDSG